MTMTMGTMTTSDREQLAYMAGFFDGEGSLGFWLQGRGNRRFSMSMGNSNLAILQMFQQRFGGSVCEKHPKYASNKLQKRMMWQWRIWGDPAWDAYYAMRPFLREKLWKNEP